MDETTTILFTTVVNFIIATIGRAIEKRKLRKKGLLVDEKIKDSTKV